MEHYVRTMRHDLVQLALLHATPVFADRAPVLVDGGQFPRFSGVVLYRRRGKEQTIEIVEGVSAL